MSYNTMDDGSHSRDEISSGSRTRANSCASSEGKDTLADRQAQSDRAITDLARTVSSKSKQSHQQLPFALEKDGSLDPHSPNFNARAWAESLYNVRHNAEQGVSPRVAGVALRNLNVHGYGSPVDYQMSVGNALIKLPTLVAQMLSGKKQRIDILQGIECLLLPGEQLCVLGPPGSGCSTLLKTIAQDTHGLEVDPSATVNYQGISPKQMSRSILPKWMHTTRRSRWATLSTLRHSHALPAGYQVG